MGEIKKNNSALLQGLQSKAAYGFFPPLYLQWTLCSWEDYTCEGTADSRVEAFRKWRKSTNNAVLFTVEVFRGVGKMPTKMECCPGKKQTAHCSSLYRRRLEQVTWPAEL